MHGQGVVRVLRGQGSGLVTCGVSDAPNWVVIATPGAFAPVCSFLQLFSMAHCLVFTEASRGTAFFWGLARTQGAGGQGYLSR
jgi:hypothetical protein